MDVTSSFILIPGHSFTFKIQWEFQSDIRWHLETLKDQCFEFEHYFDKKGNNWIDNLIFFKYANLGDWALVLNQMLKSFFSFSIDRS